ncbi:MAG: hypothetical protein ACI30K_07130 [Muribaculaceae bacterium]
MHYLKLIPLMLVLFISCKDEFKEKPAGIPQPQCGTWYEVMTNGDHFKSLTTDEDGRLTGRYYIHDDSKEYEFDGIFTGEKFILHLYTDESKQAYNVRSFTVVKFDNNELVLATYLKGHFFTRDTTQNPYLKIANIAQLLGKWECTHTNGSKNYYYFYSNGTGMDDSEFSHWFTINDWLFIKRTPSDPSYNRYDVYKYKFDKKDLLLFTLDHDAEINKESSRYVKLESFQPSDKSTKNDINDTNQSSATDTAVAAESTPQPSSSYQPTKHTTSVPVQVWRECVNCFGSGQCPYCYGQGHSINMFGDDQDCPVCTGGRCTMCAGQGGHYETEYQTRVEYY